MKKTALLLFILFPLILSLFIFFGDDKTISENENRTLKTKSDVTFKVTDGAFQNWLEGYLSDQFPLRDTLKQAETELALALGAGEADGAYIGEEYRLFQKITEADVDEASCIRYAKRINRLAADTGIPTYVMYVPSAGAALRERLPEGAPMYDCDGLYDALSGELTAAETIDIRPALSGNPENYYATDHHWTTAGVLRAYEQWRKAHGRKASDASALLTVSETFHGTLYSKVPSCRIGFDTIQTVKLDTEPDVIADGVPVSFYDESALSTKDQYNYFQGGNHGVTVVTNEENAGGDNLLILKDSFANSFVPCLVADYHQIILVDERYAIVDIRQLAEAYGVDEIAVIREIISAP